MTDAFPSEIQPVLVAFTSADGTPHKITGDRTVVGSGPDADIRIRHQEVQERHCLILRAGDSLDVFDLTTDNSLKLNGKQVDAAALAFGDEILMGDLRTVLVNPNSEVLPEGMQLAFGSPLPLSMRSDSNTDYLDSFRDVLKKAPWLAISLILHATVLLIVSMMSSETNEIEEDLPTIAAEIDSEPELMEIEEMSDDEVVEELEEELEEMESEILDTLDLEPTPLNTSDPTADDVDEVNEPSISSAAFGPGDLTGGDDRMGTGPSLAMGSIGGSLKKTVRRLQSSGLDIVILLDATASMQDEINATRTQMAQMISLLETFGINFRIGIVAFRDHGDDYQTRVAPLTSYRFKAIDFMDQLSAEGGGDFPEGVLAAVKKAARMRFSSRAEKVMILVGDAPPHESELPATIKAIEKFQKKSGRFHTVYAGSQSRGFYSSDNETQRTFHALAAAGGGQSVGIRSHAKLIEDIIALTLGVQGRDTIQRTLRKAQEGVVSRSVRRRIKSGDATYVAKQLSRPRVSPLLPSILLQENTTELIPAYLTVLRDSDIPKPNRWLAYVLLKRQLRTIQRYQSLGNKIRDLLEEFHPEIAKSKQKRLLRDLSLALEGRDIRATIKSDSKPRRLK